MHLSALLLYYMSRLSEYVCDYTDYVHTCFYTITDLGTFVRECAQVIIT